jgi:hypothetical protein
MENEEKIYTILELIKMYKEGALPEDTVVFKYLSTKGEGLIHRDEIKREAVIGGIYSVMHEDRLIGAKTRSELDPLKGMDQTKWSKQPRK